MMSASNAAWWRPADTDATSTPVEPAGAVKRVAPGGAFPYWALMAFTFVLLAAPQTLLPGLASLRLAFLVAGASVVAHLIDRLTRSQPIISPHRENLIAACLVGWAIVTLPLSYWPAGSVSFLLGTYFKTLAIFWLLGSVVDTRTRLRRTAWVLVLTAVPVAVSAVHNYLTGVYVPRGVLPNVKRIFGYDAPLTANPNDLALTLNLILPFGIGLFLIDRKSSRRALLMGLILLCALAVILTFSRAGFLTLGVVFLVYMWKLLKRPGPFWALVVLLAVSLPLLPSGYVDQMETIVHIQADASGSAQQRWSDMFAAAGFVARHPIVGVGIGMNVLAMNEQHGAAWRAVHNVYLQHAVELGLPGMGLFLLLMWSCLKRTTSVQRSTARAPHSRELFHFAESVQVSLLAFAVAAMFHPVGFHFYFYYPAGLAVAVSSIHAKESAS